MARRIIRQTAFNAGELTPRLYARTDINKYNNAVETATNCRVLPHGPMSRRNGSQYIAETKTSSSASRLLSFQYSTSSSLLLELGHQYVRFYTSDGQVMSGGNPYEVAMPYSSSEIFDVTYSQSGNDLYLCHPSYYPRILTRTANDNWALTTYAPLPPPSYESGYAAAVTCTPAATTGASINFTASGATWLQSDVGRQIVNLTPGETGRASIIGITSTTVALCDIVEDFTDTNAIASGDWKLDLSPIARLKPDASAAGSIVEINATFPDDFRGGAAAISGITKALPGVITSSSNHLLSDGDQVYIDDIEGMSLLNDRVYNVDVISANTFSLLNSSGARIDTTNYPAYASDGTFSVDFTDVAVNTFRAADVGKYLLLNNGVVQILTVESASKVTAEILKSLNSKDSTESWTMETEAWTSGRGYPRAVGVYQERIVFGGTLAQPQTLWFSESGIFNGHGAGADDDDAIVVDINSTQSNLINWFAVGRDLIIGTEGAEITVDGGSSTGAPITPSSVRQIPRRYHGSTTQTPVVVGNEVLFVQRSKLKVRSFRYDFNIDGYAADNLNFLAEHMTEGLLKEICYVQEPDSQIFAVLEDGDMLVATYERGEEVIGWTRDTTDGSYESVQSITVSEANDQVWAIVNRTIDGSTVRYVERFDRSNGTDNLHAFSDSYLTYSQPKTITGITQAGPAVVTSASHGFSNGDRLKIINVAGMTEVNNFTTIVANKDTNTFELESTAARTSLVNSTYRWTASGSGTDEYYLELAAGGDPSVSEPISTYQNDSLMVVGTAGSLALGEWDWADNDTLGFSTVYVRIAAGADPDDKGQGWVEAAYGVDSSAYSAYTSGGEAHLLVTTLSGLDHLEGETVQIRLDGAVHENTVVASGSITLDSEGIEAVVGLPYVTTIKTLALDFNTQLGDTAVGQRIAWAIPNLQVYRSTNPLLNGEVLPSRASADPMDQSVPLYSGLLRYGHLPFADNDKLTITVSDPLPLELLGIVGTVDIGDI